MSAGSGTTAEGPNLEWDVRKMAIRLEILAGRMVGCNDQATEEGRKPTHELIDEATSFVEESKATTERVVSALYVAGEWVCPKCSYWESRRILNPTNGQVSINPTPANPCPNDGEFMVRVTWRRHAMDLRKMIDDQLLQIERYRKRSSN